MNKQPTTFSKLRLPVLPDAVSCLIHEVASWSKLFPLAVSIVLVLTGWLPNGTLLSLWCCLIIASKGIEYLLLPRYVSHEEYIAQVDNCVAANLDLEARLQALEVQLRRDMPPPRR